MHANLAAAQRPVRSQNACRFPTPNTSGAGKGAQRVRGTADGFAKRPAARRRSLFLGIGPLFRIMPATLEEQFDRNFSKAQLVAEDAHEVATILS